MKNYTYTGAGRGVDRDAAADYVRDGYLLGPRTVLQGRTKSAASLSPVSSKDLAQISLLQQTLESAMGPMKGSRRAVMFSGGFDSTLMVLLAQRAGAQVTTVTVAFDEFNPHTVEGAVQAAQSLGLAHQVLPVKAVEFLSAFEALAGLTDEPILDLDLAVVYAALKKYDTKFGDTFISGMGSDQWFGDMALEDRPGGSPARLDWAIIDENAHHHVARVHGCKFIFPFLSESMLNLSQCIPAALKKDKRMLRAVASVNTIPNRGAKSEGQIPALMRQAIVRTYGERAWPKPVTVEAGSRGVSDQVLRQVVLGLWLDKAKERPEVYEQVSLHPQR